MSTHGERATEKLRHVLGAKAADELIRDTMHRAGISSLDRPDDLALFADELIRAGGLIEAVGRAIKVQALLAGAKAAPAASVARK